MRPVISGHPVHMVMANRVASGFGFIVLPDAEHETAFASLLPNRAPPSMFPSSIKQKRRPSCAFPRLPPQASIALPKKTICSVLSH